MTQTLGTRSNAGHPRPQHRRRHRRDARTRAARRRPRLHALLVRRTSRLARRVESVPGSPARTDRQPDEAHSHRLGRRHAAVLQPVQGGRAVPDARSAVSESRGPGRRPRARRRHAHGASGRGRRLQPRRHFSAAGRRPRRSVQRHAARRPHRARRAAATANRDASRIVDARFKRLRRPARGATRHPLRVRAFHQRAVRTSRGGGVSRALHRGQRSATVSRGRGVRDLRRYRRRSRRAGKSGRPSPRADGLRPEHADSVDRARRRASNTASAN